MSHNDVVVANILSDAQQHYIRDGSSSVVIELLKQAMVLVVRHAIYTHGLTAIRN